VNNVVDAVDSQAKTIEAEKLKVTLRVKLWSVAGEGQKGFGEGGEPQQLQCTDRKSLEPQAIGIRNTLDGEEEVKRQKIGDVNNHVNGLKAEYER